VLLNWQALLSMLRTMISKGTSFIDAFIENSKENKLAKKLCWRNPQVGIEFFKHVFMKR